MQRYNGQLINQFPNTINGNAAAGAQVTIRVKSSGTLASLYTTNSLSGGTLPNPITADAKGYYGFYAPDNVYTLDVNIAGTPQLEIQLQDVADLKAQFDNAVLNAGYIPVGSFSVGCTISQANGVVSDGVTYWRWDGELPKVVTAGSEPTPAAAGFWIAVANSFDQINSYTQRAEIAADAAELNAGIYQSSSAGVSAVADGAYFSVPSAELDQYLILYRKQSGVAVEVKRYPSTLAIQEIAQTKQLYTRVGGNLTQVVQTLSSPGGNDFAVIADDGSVVIPNLKLSKQQTDVIDSRSNAINLANEKPSSALAAIALADRRPIDIVMAAGDSHQLFGGYGLFGALTRALVGRYTMYASQFSRATALAYSPAGNGGLFSGADVVVSGAPAEMEVLRFPDVGGNGSPSTQTATYAFVPDGVTSAATSTDTAMSIIPIAGVDVSAAWRCDYYLTTFPTSFTGAGTITLAARLDAAPFTTLATLPFSSKTGAYGSSVVSLTVPKNLSRTSQIGFKYRLPSQNAIGPIGAFGVRALKLGATKGISISSLDARGGQSGYDLAYQAINEFKTEQLVRYFEVVRAYQIELGFKPIVVLTYSTGHNDRNENLQPSLGWRKSTVADGAEAYADNAEAWMKIYRDLWKIAGWDETELYFIVFTSQRVPATGALDAKLQSYGQISEPTFAGQSRVSYIQLENLTTATESASYPNDGLHYTTQAGYDFLAQRFCERCIPGFIEV